MSALLKKPSRRQHNGPERSFMQVFRLIRKKLCFEPSSLDSLDNSLLNCLVHAAVSRCLDFNTSANRTGARSNEAFFLVSNLRGICEDLIYLTYLRKMPAAQAQQLIKLLMGKNLAYGLLAQRRFFEANNPFQPVLGEPLQTAEINKNQSRDELRRFWRSLGMRPDGPTMFDMAANVGLDSTYRFIYYSASNFVHFNPLVLLRTGWGDARGPFDFSIRHMAQYYQSFSSFYGAVLFIGFEASFGKDYFKSSLNAEIERLCLLIYEVPRWPEIVTFEEMNKKPPLYILTHALGRLVRESDNSAKHGAILREVRALTDTEPQTSSRKG